MPEAPADIVTRVEKSSCSLANLKTGAPDSIGATVREILFRGQDYAIYRSDRGVYVHFADDPAIERAQRAAYVTLSVQICELRYLTSQMRPFRFGALIGKGSAQDSLYDHNMAQALMLLMESVVQFANGQQTQSAATQKEANDIALRALDMAVRRNTVDNTIRYVWTCVVFGLLWLAALGIAYLLMPSIAASGYYLLASAMGIIGAIFSVIVRAQSFELKPCEDSGMNKLMSIIRIGMGGIAGSALYLLLATVSANALISIQNSNVDVSGVVRMVAIIGLIGGFAERLVPNLVASTAEKLQSRAGTPGQAASAEKDAAVLNQ